MLQSWPCHSSKAFAYLINEVFHNANANIWSKIETSDLDMAICFKLNFLNNKIHFTIRLSSFPSNHIGIFLGIQAFGTGLLPTKSNWSIIWASRLWYRSFFFFWKLDRHDWTNEIGKIYNAIEVKPMFICDR